MEIHNNLDAEDSVRYILRNNIEGAFVECGVEYGRMQKIWINELITNGEKRDIYLFDTFAGLTEPCELDYGSDKNTLNNFNDVLNEWKNKKIDDKTNGWCYSKLMDVVH
jgi:hypothetical protein